MSNSNEDYLERINNLSPETILSTHNISLPGETPQIIELPWEGTIPKIPISKFSIELSKKGEVPTHINDITSFNSAFPLYHHLKSDYFALCSSNSVLIMNDSLETIQTYLEPNDEETHLCISWGLLQNSLILAVGGVLGCIQIFNVTEGKYLNALKGHFNSINCLAFQPPNCELLISGSNDLTIRLWSIRNSVQIGVFANHIQGILVLDWNPSQQIFLSAGKDSSIKFWGLFSIANELEFAKTWTGKNFPTLQVLKPLYSNNIIHKSYVDCAMFYGKLVISKAQEGRIAIWKAEDSGNDRCIVMFVLNYQENLEIDMKFSVCQVRKLLVIGGMAGEIYVYALNSDPEYVYSIEKSEGIVRRVMFTKDRIIASASLGLISVYNVE